MSIGIILIIFDIFLYVLFHDITKLQIFRSLHINSSFFNHYKDFYKFFYLHFSEFAFYKISKNFLVDALWFLSFQLICISLLPCIKTIICVFFMAFLSEILQLIFPILGTFDFLDLLIYFFITVTFCTSFSRKFSKALSDEHKNPQSFLYILFKI